MIRAIAHPSDFSPEGRAAFDTALRLAVASRCSLDLLHVRGRHETDHYEKFPRTREVLQRWGMLAPGASIEDISVCTGIKVRKIEIRDDDAVEGLSRFLDSHRPDLLVMATHGRGGTNRWLRGSVSAHVAQTTHVPVLLIGPSAEPLVDGATGALSLGRILAPIARDPAPQRALRTLQGLMEGLAAGIDIVHVGDDVPSLHDGMEAASPMRLLKVRQLEGPVIETILQEAASSHASLIAMPTAGHHGFLDALRGSTTERVVARAPCPVLALPA